MKKNHKENKEIEQRLKKYNYRIKMRLNNNTIKEIHNYNQQ